MDARDTALLNALCSRTRRYAAGEDLVREGDRPGVFNIFLDGWACRYKSLEDGRHQKLALLLPGDICDLNNVVLREMDHSIAAVTAVNVAHPTDAEIRAAMRESEAVCEALWWHSLTVVAMQREWTLNLGQRSALERIGCLLCEIHLRLNAVGLVSEDGCEIPLTQVGLAEATGLTPVHVNRTLQEMRALGLVQLKSRQLFIPDIARLMSAATFNPAYLHLQAGAGSPASATLPAS